MSTNVMIRDLDISPPQNSDGRRLEVVVEGSHYLEDASLH